MEPKEETQLQTVSKPLHLTVTDTGPLAYLWDTARFEHMFRLASAMAQATLIPDHLRRNKHREFEANEIKANCFRIVNQALRWGVDPFSIVDDTYVVGGKLCYQSKVIAALINIKAPLKKRLSKTFTGKEGADDFTITVAGTFIGDDDLKTTTMSVGYAKTENQLWKKNPRLKLWYSAVIQWAREYTPELIVGIFTDDDAERMDEWKTEAAKPARAQLSEKPNLAPAEPKRSRKVKEDPSPSKAESEIADQAAQEVVDAEKTIVVDPANPEDEFPFGE